MSTFELSNQLHSLLWLAPKIIAAAIVLSAAWWVSRSRA